MTMCGFCAINHAHPYKCANCGHEERLTKITNFYKPETVKWENKVCPKCGFKSFKPLTYSEIMKK